MGEVISLLREKGTIYIEEGDAEFLRDRRHQAKRAIMDERMSTLAAGLRRRELLQELFVKYVDYDIVDLEAWEFEAFARFCDPGEDALKQWSQYEFILYVKQRYQVFRMLPRDLPAEEYEYHLDDD